jgi:ribosomal-protein-alanine N-acetyltransferase
VRTTSTTQRDVTGGFTTARLVAVPLTLEDTPLFERLWGDEGVGRALGGTRDAQQVHEAVVAGIEHWRGRGFGRWVLRAGGQLIGTVKLAEWVALGRPEVELGYALLPEFWSHGYAIEAGAGALEHARRELGLTEVVAFTLPENQPSLAVMQHLGFGPEQRLLLEGREHILRRRRLGQLPSADGRAHGSGRI